MPPDLASLFVCKHRNIVYYFPPGKLELGVRGLWKSCTHGCLLSIQFFFFRCIPPMLAVSLLLLLLPATTCIALSANKVDVQPIVCSMFDFLGYRVVILYIWPCAVVVSSYVAQPTIRFTMPCFVLLLSAFLFPRTIVSDHYWAIAGRQLPVSDDFVATVFVVPRLFTLYWIYYNYSSFSGPQRRGGGG